jgi:glycosyltransferase involved in cell wall biosynthesis
MVKKILFVWEKISPVTSNSLKQSPNQLLGGGEVSLINLAQLLKESGTSVDLFVVYHSMLAITNFNQIFYIESCFVPGWLKRFQLLIKIIIKLSSIMNNYDTIIINDEPLLSMVMIALKPFCRAKLIFWSHLSKTYFQQHARLVSRMTNYLALKYCAHLIVCVSNYAKDKMVKFLGDKFSNKIDVIYNIVYKKRNKDDVALPARLNSDKYEILSVSRLTREKGIDVLINAFNIIVNQYQIKNIHLTVCGDGQDYQELSKLINQFNLGNYISLIGYVADPHIYYAACDIFVLSSHTEALPLVVVEALLHGKPVVSTNTGAAEVLGNGECGVIVDCGDFVALADAIVKLINDKSFRDTVTYNTENCLASFSHDKILSQWLQVLSIE